ncbi:MAG: serine/threonine-protein kinase [Coriobacteriales bacterium]
MPGPLILDRYRPLGTAGSGGSGTVQICWDTRIQRRVAIKRIAVPESSPDGSIPGLAEARTGAMLKHPNIVSVIDFETSGAEAFLIMEAIEGPSLAKLIDSTHRGEMDLDIVATVLEAVGEALDFAHENAVLHLDIKPDNILIDRSGTVKVTDFGISELSCSGGFGSASGGTIGYMPPEQMNGDDLDQRTDGFALAVVAYEMLTGRNPYNARDLAGSLRLMQNTVPDPVSRSRQDTPPELDDALACAMDPEPGERFETVLEMVDELVPLLGDPAAGREKLRALMEDDEAEDEDEPRLRRDDLWSQLSPRFRMVAGRVCCAILCWWTAALGLEVMGILSTGGSMLLALAPAVAGAVLPGVGALAALAFLGAGIIVNPALPAWLGAALVALAALWWGLAGRERTAASNAALAASPLGLAWATPLGPLLAGFTLRPLPAAATALVQGGVVLALSGTTGETSLLHCGLAFASVNAPAPLTLQGMLADPATWVTWASWILVAVLVSALCSTESRVLSIFGIVAGCALLFAAQVLAANLATGAWAAPAAPWCVSIGVCGFAALVLGFAGAPYRYKEEE